MCRWMAWHGQPLLLEELLFKTQHGLVDQSLHSRLGALHPDNARLQRARGGDRIVVSEPLSDLPGAWHEIPRRPS